MLGTNKRKMANKATKSRSDHLFRTNRNCNFPFSPKRFSFCSPWFFLFLFRLSLLGSAGGSFTVVVPYDDEVCFHVRTPGGAKSIISGNFDILDDELPPEPVNVVLHNSVTNMEAWRSDPHKSEGTFHVQASGRHEFCILNHDDRFMYDDEYSGRPQNFNGKDRTVGFNLRVTPLKRGLEGEAEGPDDLLTSEMLMSSTQLIELLENMEDHQDYLRSRESVHRNLVEQTFRRIVRWTVVEAIFLITVAGAQVIYLKKFFERRSYL